MSSESKGENDTASTYDWIADSASTSHVTNQRHLMSDFIPRDESITGFGGNCQGGDPDRDGARELSRRWGTDGV